MTPHRLFPRALLLVASLLPLAVAAPAGAQVRAYQLTSDNDAYNFWIPMAVRPDYEYSNGLRRGGGAGGGGRWSGLASAAAPCAAGDTLADAEAGCASTTVEAGQRLYAPRKDSYEPMPRAAPVTPAGCTPR